MGAAVAEKIKSGLRPVPKVELVDNRLKITFDEKTYEESLKDAGIDVNVEQLKKFNDQFIKDITVITGDALIEGYKEHKEATGFEMELNSKLFEMSGKGNKITHSALSNTDSTGFSFQTSINVRGIKATIAAKKREIYGIITAED